MILHLINSELTYEAAPVIVIMLADLWSCLNFRHKSRLWNRIFSRNLGQASHASDEVERRC